MIDELTCRRLDFRAGRAITLADAQSWMFPAPRECADLATGHPDDEYVGLLRAVWEAEDLPERRLAELTLALYLFELNYHLSPAQLELLFTFRSGSPELADSQHAFRALAEEHLQSLYPEAVFSFPSSVDRPARHGIRARFRSWWRALRALLQMDSPVAER
ncbi:MAG: hypothetical protein ACP5XB_08050 [Isosphaeraceae bacterium]